MTDAPVAMGSAGMGGYALGVCRFLAQMSQAPQPMVRLLAVCDPQAALHAKLAASLEQQGVRVHERFEDVLTEPIEAVWLPVPIHLHRAFTEQALMAGKAVLCEKPAAGSVDDIDAMIAARDRTGLTVAIGYQGTAHPHTLMVKRALLDGVLGAVRSVCVVACAPRGRGYYTRSSWAGVARREGIWVMDSPASNAFSHYLALPLFLLGEDEASPARPLALEAELYRVNPIETFDTCSLRVRLPQAPLLVLFTHACCRSSDEPLITIHGERGVLQWKRTGEWLLQEPGRELRLFLPHQPLAQPLAPLLSGFVDHLRGRVNTSVMMPTLEIARAQTVVTNGASEACPVYEVPDDHIVKYQNERDHYRAIVGIEDAFLACAAAGQMLHESGRVPWSCPAGRRDLRDYRHFSGPARPSPTPVGETPR